MTEKFYMACDCDQQLRAEYGPFKTSGEAEKQARLLGFGWVLVYTHTVDEFGTILDVKTRFWELAPSIEKLRSVIAGVAPLTTDEERFFKQYEDQLDGKTDDKMSRL